jgi:penicillin-binding protein 1B
MYRNTQSFDPPAGIMQEAVDPQSGELATPSCPQVANEYFIAGSEPTQYCQLHGGQNAQNGQGWLTHLFGKEQNSSAPPTPTVNTSGEPLGGSQKQRPKSTQTAKPGQKPGESETPSAEEPEKKKGLLDRIFGIFGGSKQPADNSKPKP